jgi:hypothetical protein
MYSSVGRSIRRRDVTKYKNEKKQRGGLTLNCEAHTYDLVIPPPFSATIDDETAKK